MRILARDERIPKPLRWIAGIGLLPIPGPVDEVVLVLVAPVFFTFYREPMRDAWRRSQEKQEALEAVGLRLDPREVAGIEPAMDGADTYARELGYVLDAQQVSGRGSGRVQSDGGTLLGDSLLSRGLRGSPEAWPRCRVLTRLVFRSPLNKL
jgi:hypothetical protein